MRSLKLGGAELHIAVLVEFARLVLDAWARSPRELLHASLSRKMPEFLLFRGIKLENSSPFIYERITGITRVKPTLGAYSVGQAKERL